MYFCVSKRIKRINIYLSYNKDYYNNNHYTMGTFPARVNLGGPGRASWRWGCLLKFSQGRLVGSLWNVGRCWESSVLGLVVLGVLLSVE